MVEIRPRSSARGVTRHVSVPAMRADSLLPEPAGVRQFAVDRVCGADQAEVGECLWEVAEVFAVRAELLGVEAEVVGVSQHLLEQEPSLLGISGAGKILAVPERAYDEGALLAV